jgi:two-component system response regulator FixJ
MITAVYTSENNLYGWPSHASESINGSRRGNPVELHLPAAARLQPRIDMTTPAVETVFIADPRVSEQTILAAESWGLASQAFSSGSAVLEANIEHQKGCLITELRLPDMSGIELLEELKLRASILPAIVLTAHADLASAVRATRLGAVAVLEKPCSEADLSSAVREAIVENRQQSDVRLKAIEMRARLKALSADETALIELILDGVKNTVIARRVGMSLRTVENRRRQVYEKMGAECLADLIQRVLLAKQSW